MRIAIATLIAIGFATPVLADDDTPTPAQREAVMKAITAAACSNP